MSRARAERASALVALLGAVLMATPSKVWAGPDAGTLDGGARDAGLAGAPTRPIINHVVRHMPAGFSDAQDGGLISVHAGDPFNADAIRDSIESLYATGQFSDIVVSRDGPPDGGDPTIIFDLIAEERIQNMTFLGAPSFARSDLTRAALDGLVPTHGPSVSAGLPAPFFPEELEAMRGALERALERHGYASASAPAHLEPIDAVNVDIAFTIDEGTPTRVSSVKFTGDLGKPIEQLVPNEFLHVGDILDEDEVTHALDGLRAEYQRGAFYRAKVEAPHITRSADGLRADLTIPIEAGPIIDFAFRGNRSFDGRELKPRLEFSRDETLDADAEALLALRLQRFYVLSGFADARVHPEELWSLDRRHLTVAFAIDEGLPLRVTSRHFVGQEHFSESFLLDRLDESLRAEVPGPPDVGGAFIDENEAAVAAGHPRRPAAQYTVGPATVFAEEPYQDAVTRILALYTADGYLDASVTPSAVEIDDAHRTASVTLSVIEGPVTHVGQITLVGVPDGPKRLLAQRALHTGQPYSGLNEEAARASIEHELQHEGYLFASVQASESDRTGDHKTTEQIFFQAKPGPQVHVRRIIIRGNERTREGIIDAAIELKEGDAFDPDRMDATQRNLIRLGIFSRVTVEPVDRDHPDVEKDLLVSVEERPRLDLTHGPGLSLVDGPRYTVDLALNNVQGQGFSIVAHGKVDYFNLSYPVLSGLDGLRPASPPYAGIGGNGNVGLRSPGIFNSPVDAHLDLVGERQDRPAFFFDSLAVVMGLDWHVVSALTASISVSPIEYDYISLQESLPQIFTAPSGVSPAELQELRLVPGGTLLYSLTPALTLDLRDNATQPHKGFWATVNTEIANSLFDDKATDPEHFLFYAKPTVTLKGYIPIGRATLGLTASAGRVLPLADGSNTPATKRFFLGGATTLRGYAVDELIPEDDRAEIHQEVDACRGGISQVGCSNAAKVIDVGDLWPSFGGQAFVLYKAEMRFPLIGALEAGIFVDIGDLWDTPPTLDVQLFQLRTLHYTPGFGIHYNTPFGPLSLDLGFNPKPDTLLNETPVSLSYLQFSIGQF